jgi:hypothetical protein
MLIRPNKQRGKIMVQRQSIATVLPTDICALDDTHTLGVEVVVWHEDEEFLGRPFARVFCSEVCEDIYIDTAGPA